MEKSARLIILLGVVFALAGCDLPRGAPHPPATMEGIEVALQATALARTPTRLPPTETPIRPTSSHTAQPSATSTPIPTNTPLPSLTPTYSVLRGYVVPAQVSCRYGPGAVYLYKYGLVGGSRLEIIGRLPDASWILIQAIGGDNPCWVNAELFDIEGDVISVAPVDVHVVMAWSPYYSALTGVSASRTEDTVTVFWNLLILRAGDDSGQIPYVVEAWTCVNGQIEFNAIGSWTFAAEIQDEKGCAEPSYARVFAAEKHGYTQWVVVPIPPHPTP